MKVSWEPLFIFSMFLIARQHQAESLGFKRSIMDSSDALMFRIRSFCDVFQDLSSSQREICHKENFLMGSVAEGANMAHEECKNQFKNERWNCSISEKSSMLKRMRNHATKEAAFTYALVCAGVIHVMARDCMKGVLESCHCSQAKRPKNLQPAHKWGGCGDNIEYGIEFTKKFLDGPMSGNINENTDLKVGGKILMDLHNNEAGRQAILKHRVRVCKCHGVTGNCATQTCWYQVNGFESIGNYLKQKYLDTIKVKAIKRRKTKKLSLKFKTSLKSLLRKKELVYIDDSPNFCHKNPGNYVMGTVGRQCQKTAATKSGSCDTLCCSHKYKPERKVIAEKCDCNFEWCCTVRCKICRRQTITHTCL